MPQDVLEEVIIRFPGSAPGFRGQLALLLGALGQNEGGVLHLRASEPGFWPRVSLDLVGGLGVVADFVLTGGETISVPVENTTGQTRANPQAYLHLGIEEVQRRFAAAGIRVVGADHVGINLPWFAPGLHPRIQYLREKLAPCCLYHRFPSGEPWDFILPGDGDEISRRRPVDYARTRRPKFELVSFDKDSTPLVQLDVQVNAGYAEFSRLFPEALGDPGLRNVWVYLESPFGVDVCLVLNEFSARDWSDFFAGARL